MYNYLSNKHITEYTVLILIIYDQSFIYQPVTYNKHTQQLYKEYYRFHIYRTSLQSFDRYLNLNLNKKDKEGF
jgi:hypothetical protein